MTTMSNSDFAKRMMLLRDPPRNSTPRRPMIPMGTASSSSPSPTASMPSGSMIS